MKKILVYSLMLGISISFSNCDDPDDAAATPATPATPTTPKSFTNVVFSSTNQWFSLSGSTSATKDSTAAKLVPTTLDIGYIW
jgi:hypothetical protein